MQAPPKIKVCGLTREEDVNLSLSLGADYFGFILYPQSPRSVSLDRAVELAASLPVGQRVAVDVATKLEDLKSYRDAGFDYFQIHFGADFEHSNLAEYSKIVGKDKLWLAPRLASEDTFPENILDYADTILIDTFAKDQFGGTGKVGDWARFNTLKERYPQTNWVLAGGLSPSNLLESRASSAADHLDINSGVESTPGIKDEVKLREAFKVLR
ncbi:MAG: phosphoribosylanthranilate isomerase [Verrucomicrobiota bacterium]|nr:phosphoribosylanthranilate isomerase [Verrucomicrobiota bacterium]